MSAGYANTCAVASGAAYCWGWNGRGELGNGATTEEATPVAVSTSGVLSGTTLTAITTGAETTCALGNTGKAYCWGYGGSGELGNNTTTTGQTTPVAVTVGSTSALSSSTVLTQITTGGQTPGGQTTCAQDSSGTDYCWGATVGNGGSSFYSVPVLVGPQAPVGVTATAGYATAAVSWTAPTFLNNGTLTGYSASVSPGTSSCTPSGTSCGISNLTNGVTYTISVSTVASTGTSAASTATVVPGGLAMTAPSSLGWSLTDTGVNRSVVDTNSGDQQLTVADSASAGWHVTFTATTLTTGTHSLPDTGTIAVTASTSSVSSTAAPSASCAGGSCTLPTNTTTYPVQVNTASSSPPVYTIYDTSSGTGVDEVTLGGSTAANPIGWWINVPASAHAGSYTSTITFNLVSGP